MSQNQRRVIRGKAEGCGAGLAPPDPCVLLISLSYSAVTFSSLAGCRGWSVLFFLFWRGGLFLIDGQRWSAHPDGGQRVACPVFVRRGGPGLARELLPVRLVPFPIPGEPRASEAMAGAVVPGTGELAGSVQAPPGPPCSVGTPNGAICGARPSVWPARTDSRSSDPASASPSPLVKVTSVPTLRNDLGAQPLCPPPYALRRAHSDQFRNGGRGSAERVPRGSVLPKQPASRGTSGVFRVMTAWQDHGRGDAAAGHRTPTMYGVWRECGGCRRGFR